jgi:hypothetical protein
MRSFLLFQLDLFIVAKVIKGENCAKVLIIIIVGRATLKMLRRKSKTQFVKQERNTQLRI